MTLNYLNKNNNQIMVQTVDRLRKVREDLYSEGRAIVNITKSSRATSLIITSLEKSRMWLGKCIGEIGLTRSPYAKQSARNVYVPPTSDIADAPYLVKGPYQNEILNEVVHLNYARDEYQAILHRLEGDISLTVKAETSRKAVSYLEKAIEELELAKMYVGVRLSEIRKFVVQNPTEETLGIISKEVADKLYEELEFTATQETESLKDFKAEEQKPPFISDVQPSPLSPDPQNGKVLEEFKKDTEVITSEGPGATFQTENPGTNEVSTQEAELDKKPIEEAPESLEPGKDSPAL
jgi:hypothetical protein